MDVEYTECSPYFRSYEDLGVHELMLRDKPRTEAYLRAIQCHSKLFHNRVVLDVGTGTGILSMFAARYGNAKKVYAVEAAPAMCRRARELIAANGLSDIIEVIQGEVEEITLPMSRVDIIISEWMGFYLLHESMLDSVLFARDKWLAPDGHMFPSGASLFFSPVSLKEWYDDKIGFWKQVYGFNFDAVIEEAKEILKKNNPYIQFREGQVTPILDTTKKEEEGGIARVIEWNDLRTLKREVLTQEIRKRFKVEVARGINGEDSRWMHGFALWFEVTFQGDTSSERVILSTAPSAPATHWSQTVVVFGEEFRVEAGTRMAGEIRLRPGGEGEERRKYEIEMSFADEEEQPSS